MFILDNDKYSYKLKKIKENRSGFIPIGNYIVGSSYFISFKNGTVLKTVSYMDRFDYIITSKIISWTKEDDKYIVTTENSIYELTEVIRDKKNIKK